MRAAAAFGYRAVDLTWLSLAELTELGQGDKDNNRDQAEPPTVFSI